jgi:hypothetical protein
VEKLFENRLPGFFENLSKLLPNILPKLLNRVLFLKVNLEVNQMTEPIKLKKEIEKEFSYSKKYRLMKSLFDHGAVAKFKPEEKDVLNYFLIPPSFLSIDDIDPDIVNYLEKNQKKQLTKEIIVHICIQLDGLNTIMGTKVP